MALPKKKVTHRITKSRIKAPDIRPKRSLKIFKFKPLGIGEPVQVYLLNKKDFNAVRKFYLSEVNIIPANSTAFAVWNKGIPGRHQLERISKIFMTVEGIHNFAHELRHIVEQTNFHKDQ